MVTATLRQSGGSVILAIPKVLLETVGLRVDSRVNIDVREGMLTLAPGYSIDELVAGITPENSHALLEAGERGTERIEW